MWSTLGPSLDCTHLSSSHLVWCPLYRVPQPTLACTHFNFSCPSKDQGGTTLAHAHFSSRHPTRTALARSAPGPPATAPASHPAKGTRYAESTQGLTIHKMILSSSEKWLFQLIHKNKHKKSSKVRRQGNMLQMKGQDKTSDKELKERT